MVRSHWLIENGLHWVLDMVFRDDECRLSKDHAPANFCTIKHMAQNLTRRTPEKLSLRAEPLRVCRRLQPLRGWSNEDIEELLA
jgi:hypothetical protein